MSGELPSTVIVEGVPLAEGNPKTVTSQCSSSTTVVAPENAAAILLPTKYIVGVGM
jgi:hypothetical protein